ncbi:hypothetical protein JMA_42080 (plasmid) [Jeotgalibacillus malaysiensis]|uniref:TM2 domain-containing protein n=1 Tax=Jeotgalibacillus malaysiensis TaxID=1508404 RepID=A0A0B5ATI0_9BACL|nr:TM2 domain-containing protein [Jeotgalibacillus malaysiensis]AJD93525.1 hypothetical protein JMA_42080 [Jeotgalibacillus malaysiensis]
MDSTFMAKQDLTTQELQILASETEKRKKSSGTAWILLLLLGSVGAHRFYLGHTGIGIAMVATWIVSWMLVWVTFLLPISIWILVELFLLSGLVKNENQKIEKEVIDKILLMRNARKNDVVEAPKTTEI